MNKTFTYLLIAILLISVAKAQKIPSKRVTINKTIKTEQPEVDVTCPIVNINLSYEPGNLNEIPCPVTITFKGEIVVSGPCYLQYRFLKNGEIAGPTQYLNATSVGNYPVMEVETFSEPSTGNNRTLEVIAPCTYRSSKINFIIPCPNLTKGETYKYTPPETDTYSTPTGACCVSNVYLTANQVSHFGDCPFTINYKANVATNERCIFQYQFYNGDTPIGAVQSFIAQSSGNHTITESETFYKDEVSKRSLKIISPCPTESNSISIHVECNNK